jgi:hypothetical protein
LASAGRAPRKGLEILTDFFQQFLRVERLAEKPAAGADGAFFPDFLIEQGRYENDRDMLRVWVIFQAAGDPDSVDIGKGDIQEQEVGMLLPGDRQSIASAAGGEDGVSGVGQDFLQHLESQLIVIDHQDFLFLRLGFSVRHLFLSLWTG